MPNQTIEINFPELQDPSAALVASVNASTDTGYKETVKQNIEDLQRESVFKKLANLKSLERAQKTAAKIQSDIMVYNSTIEAYDNMLVNVAEGPVKEMMKETKDIAQYKLDAAKIREGRLGNSALVKYWVGITAEIARDQALANIISQLS